MTVRKRSAEILAPMNIPVSYKLLAKNRLYDCRNVVDNQDILDTRNGILRFNTTSLGAEILSASYFKSDAGTRYRLAKVGSVIYRVAASGSHTSVKTGLGATSKHRGVTLNNKHIIAVDGENGLFQYDGTNFTQLGQAAPATGSVAAAAGGALADKTWQVGLTYYSSTTGFESNAYGSAQQATSAGNNTVAVTSIPATAANATIDKVRVYIKNITDAGSYLFVTELNLGTTTYNIIDEPTSTRTPPTTHAAPIAGGAKYLAAFGKKLAHAGNSTYKSDVFLSEDYLPDAYDDTATAKTLHIPGDGDITGIAVGLFDDSDLRPFLVAFKKTSTTIYTEVSGSGYQSTIDDRIGCVSADTIKVRNGVVTFMSSNGWYSIRNGSLIKKQDKGTYLPLTLGDGDIDDIFSRDGWACQVNSSVFENFFSAYYSTRGHYLTFVAEAGNTRITKAYNFEERIGGFRVFEFQSGLTCACEGEDDDGDQVVFLGDDTGTLFAYSVKNSRHDEDESGNSRTIAAFAYMPYVLPGDSDITANFRKLTIKAIGSDNAITCRVFPGFGFQNSATHTFDVANSGTGFTLDVSQLDIDVLGDERVPVQASADITCVGRALMIGFYQDILDASMGLLSAQVTYNKNGNDVL